MKHSKGKIRKLVREFVCMAKGYGCTEEMIHQGVNERVPGDANITEVREAIEWNVAEDYMRQRENEDTEETEYVITGKGEAKEAIK